MFESYSRVTHYLIIVVEYPLSDSLSNRTSRTCVETVLVDE
jgi:hypothetical protein